LFSLVRSIQAWGSCFQEGKPWPPPAGWKTLAQLELPEDGTDVTAGAVILDEAAEQLVVVVRGTANPFEWDLDWQYNQVEVRRMHMRGGAFVGCRFPMRGRSSSCL
jgi:hypothetical protein